MQNCKVLFVFILLVVLIGMGCSDDEPVKVGFLLHALDKERWENDRDFLTEKVMNLGGTLRVEVAGNDAIAMGVLNALKDNGIDREVLVAGMDADLRNLQEIVKGTQTITVYKPIEKMAATTAGIAFKLANGEKCENTYQTVSNGEMLVPAVLHDAVIVNKENLKLTVISEGYQTEEAVYK